MLQSPPVQRHLRVASVPAAHAYVDAIVDPEVVALLPDPIPPNATLVGQWWPPQWLEPDYLAGRIGEVDVLHVHFGFDSTPPAQLEAVAALLAEHRLPLVLTVHDLHNPHFPDPDDHQTRLAVLVGAATVVTTLTNGAADEIAHRWGRRPIVVPHPLVLSPDVVGMARPARPAPVVAVHAKNLRANIDPWPVLDVLTALDDQQWQLRLDVDDEAFHAPRAAELTEDRLSRYREAGVDVRIHPRMSDVALTTYLRDVDVLVLPYRFGTHSGWVEACHDAGVVPVVPRCGFLHEQLSSPSFGYDRDGLDANGLRDAVDEAVRLVDLSGTDVDVQRRGRRAAQRDEIRGRFTELYRHARNGS